MIAAAVALLMVVAPASAITKGGVVDSNDQYPYVGLMVAYVDGVPSWRCTGTLVSPKLFITAGHCTSGADEVEIWFDWDLTDAALHNYPTGPGDASGEPYTHPDYVDDQFYLHDLGVVVLDGKGYKTPTASTPSYREKMTPVCSTDSPLAPSSPLSAMGFSRRIRPAPPPTRT